MPPARIMACVVLYVTWLAMTQAATAVFPDAGIHSTGQVHRRVHRRIRNSQAMTRYQLHAHDSASKGRKRLDFGALYYAYHKDPVKAAKYITAVVDSASSLKRHSPDVPVALLTNAHVDRDAIPGQVIDMVFPIRDEDIIDGLAAKQSRQWWTRTLYLNATPFDVTVQIDSDRTICSSIDDLTAFIKGYDMLHVSAGVLPAFDNGVMVYKKGVKFQALLDNWLKNMARNNRTGDDQPALALALAQTFKQNGFTSGVLPPTYQVKLIPALGETWGTPAASHSLVLTGTVKIVAGPQHRCDVASQHAPRPRVIVSNRTHSTVVLSQDECNAFLSGRCRRAEMDWGRAIGLHVTEREQYIAKVKTMT